MFVKEDAWNGYEKSIMLLEQKYTGEQDYIDHFNDLLLAFQDDCYTRVNGKMLFVVFAPYNLPDTKLFIQTWNRLAQENGFKGFYFVALNKDQTRSVFLRNQGYVAIVEDLMDSFRSQYYSYSNLFFYLLREMGVVFGNNYKDYCDFLNNFSPSVGTYPCIYPNWDNSARSGMVATMFRNAEPAVWGNFCKQIFKRYKDMPDDESLVFVKSWNECGEGNYLDPGRRYGRVYINQMRVAF